MSAGVDVEVLGRTRLRVDGAEVAVPPTALAVLARLLLADGEAVTVDELYRDVWEAGPGPVGRADRVSVQKRIVQLRQALSRNTGGGAHRAVVSTEPGPVSAYRLDLPRERVDAHHFRDLVARAQRADAVTEASLLESALTLWRGRPLMAVERLPFARQGIADLCRVRLEARRALLRVNLELGRFPQALHAAEDLAADHPGDGELAATVAELRSRVRSLHRGLLRREFDDPAVSVVIARGDLLTQRDTHLVVGFTDTFDTATDLDIVINQSSLQGQLVSRLYGGDRARLDRDLRVALRGVQPVAKESRTDKRRGKLVRYPLGTVAVLRLPGVRVFGVAYSRMGNDLVARSSVTELAHGLDRLWEALRDHGQLMPVALPLVGSGLARLDGTRHEDLLRMIVESFVAASRRGRFCPALTIVLPQPVLDRIGIPQIAAALAAP
ncbi:MULTISPECIES: macro domain-containing protein [Streptomyces]|uniref:macro domain-containing protein n=1 Tax=Streptomyces TaxID=1883 RepID=UPI0004CDCE1A|nr:MULTISPECIES: macro domain-containing protein [Streptomyces]